MGRRRRNRKPEKTQATAQAAAPAQPAGTISRRRVWFYRVLLAVGGPAIFLFLCEAVLRVGDYGYATSFFLPTTPNGVLIPNNQFSRRFFGPSFARQPASFAIPRVKSANTVRIFVLGESAAFGDPQPEFGLPRVLQAMLGLRYPDTRFEVVNAAMTGINSHAILPIARDCADADGDIWVIYMGNNEVVGPFGAGTVFGPKAPSTSVIRSNLAIQTTRIGQLLAALQQTLQPPPASKSEWGGMLMFVENHVPHDDPRMTKVYRHFEHNLSKILEIARESGIGVVLSTVAVNLKDCAPFASQHRPDLSPNAVEEWQKFFQAGMDAQVHGDQRLAIQQFQSAERIDDKFAELHFAWAKSLLALGDRPEAGRRFELARDRDVLRFRCDSKLNGITRRLATDRQNDQILLVDAERAFAQATADRVPGADHFYEHVHLTFEGNYLLARAIVTQVEKLLPETVRQRASASDAWPSAADCAQRLAWTDWHRLAAVEDVLGRLSDPPFVNQSDHAEQLRRLSQQAAALRAPAQHALANAKSVFHEAIAASPKDPVLHGQLGAMLGRAGDAQGATEAARLAVMLLPMNPDYWMLLGATLATQQQYLEAAQAFEKAFQLDDQNVWALQGAARVYSKLERRQDAMNAYRQAIQIKPRFGAAYLELGQLLERAGQKDEAEQQYRLALENRIHRPAELTALARLCTDRGWHDEALKNYMDALQLSPGDAKLHSEVGRTLAALGRRADARQHFAEAVRLAPETGEPRFLLGLELGRANEPAAAVEQFREAVRLMPDVPEARLNLAIALKNLGDRSEALAQFREVLRHSPNNAVAIQSIRELEATPTAPQ